MAFSMGTVFGDNQTLKSYGSKTMNFNSEQKMYVESASQSKMYRRSMFNIAANLDGINQWFSSCYAPNIFDVSITINSDGLKLGTNGLFQVTEYYNNISSFFSSSIIYRILRPRDIVLISSTSSSDEDGESTLVNDKGYIEKYRNTSYSSNKTYRVYFPRVTRGGSGDNSVLPGEDNDMIDIINQSKLYSVSVSCQDKLYTLKATSLT